MKDHGMSPGGPKAPLASQRNPSFAGDVGPLLALLGEQRELYGRLRALADSQRALITRDEAERLLGILAERQRLIDRLEHVAVRVRPYQQHWQALRSRMTPSQTEEVDRLVAEVNGLLAGILETDRADAQLLAARKGSTGAAMTTLKAGHQAGAAYAAAGYPRPASVEWTDQ